METNKINSTHESRSFSAIYKNNLSFKSGLGLIPVVAVSTTLQNALAITLLYSVIILLNYLFISIYKSKKPSYMMIPIYAIFSALAFIPAFYLTRLVFPTAQDMLGIYLYTAVVDTIVLFDAEKRTRGKNLGYAMKEAIITILSLGLVAVFIGAAREIMSRGTIYGFTIIKNVNMRGVSAPFFGFIFVGLLAALVNSVTYAVTNPKQKEQKKINMKHKTKEQEIEALLEKQGDEANEAKQKRLSRGELREIQKEAREAREREKEKRRLENERQKELSAELKVHGTEKDARQISGHLGGEGETVEIGNVINVASQKEETKPLPDIKADIAELATAQISSKTIDNAQDDDDEEEDLEELKKALREDKNGIILEDIRPEKAQVKDVKKEEPPTDEPPQEKEKKGKSGGFIFNTDGVLDDEE